MNVRVSASGSARAMPGASTLPSSSRAPRMDGRAIVLTHFLPWREARTQTKRGTVFNPWTLAVRHCAGEWCQWPPRHRIHASAAR